MVSCWVTARPEVSKGEVQRGCFDTSARTEQRPRGFLSGERHNGNLIVWSCTWRVSKKPIRPVTPVQTGVQEAQRCLDSGFRRNDVTCVRILFETL